MTIIVVKVVVAIVVALRKAALIAPMTVALVMATVAIEGLGISTTDITPWPRATEIAACVRSRTAISVATSVVGERARAARAAA
jgi:hypothetical protein